ncbi:MAG TPA: SRPBCC domain-containing protein [Chitinophagaceae bacterium]|jgi:uncharacterized protein YndB with AHSA1/START domain|nr:SRPBCC domain-containing protein [Chitinophagaceae bacterium]
MERQKFSIRIDAPREKVWKALWEDANYRAWTAAFSEGSYAKSDWKKGSKVYFLNSNEEGMVAEIADVRPNEYMSFRHLGEVKGELEDTMSERIQAWAGAMENYTLKTVDGKTELVVDMDLTEDMKDYFEKTWPKALDKLKELAEKN